MKVYAYITDNGDGSSSTTISSDLNAILIEVNNGWQGEKRLDSGEEPFTTFEDADNWCKDDSYERGSLDRKEVDSEHPIPLMTFYGGYQWNRAPLAQLDRAKVS